MALPSNDQARLWGVIVACGLENEYERDWLGRIRSQRTKMYVRAEISPELAQYLAGASAQLQAASGVAQGAIASTREAFGRLLSSSLDREPPK